MPAAARQALSPFPARRAAIADDLAAALAASTAGTAAQRDVNGKPLAEYAAHPYWLGHLEAAVERAVARLRELP